MTTLQLSWPALAFPNLSCCRRVLSSNLACFLWIDGNKAALLQIAQQVALKLVASVRRGRDVWGYCLLFNPATTKKVLQPGSGFPSPVRDAHSPHSFRRHPELCGYMPWCACWGRSCSHSLLLLHSQPCNATPCAEVSGPTLICKILLVSIASW